MTHEVADSRRPMPGWLASTLSQLLIAGIWVAIHYLAAALEYAPHASLWYPPVAVTFAALAMLGLRALPALVFAGVFVTVLTGSATAVETPALVGSGLLFMAGHALAYGALAAAMAASVRHHGTGAVLRLVLTFLIGGVVAATFAAASGLGTLTLFGLFDGSDTTATVVAWLIGDFAALVTLAPVMLLSLAAVFDWLGVRYDRTLLSFDLIDSPRIGQARFAAKLTLLLGMILAILLASALFPDQEPVLFVLFFVIILQNWIVHTEGAWRSVLAMAVASLTVVTFNAWLDLGDRALVLQFAILILAASTYFGLSVPQLYADNARLRRLLTEDTLTRAASRHHFMEHAAVGVARALSTGEPAALVMIDLDHLKEINDTRGHVAGDRALTELVRRLKSRLRGRDIVGRLGGDEFGVFMPDTRLDRAFSTAEELQRAIENAPLDDEGQVRLSASFGVAELTGEGDGLDRLIERADVALYEAKQGGRNRVAMG